MLLVFASKMVRTMTVLWIGVVWLTVVQALTQINPWLEEHEVLDIETVDANMTIKEVSAHWIDVYYDIDDSIPMTSFIQYLHESDVGNVLCPPSSPQRGDDRRTYSCRLKDLDMCTSYDLQYYGIPSNVYNASFYYYAELFDVLTAADETTPPSNLTCNTSSSGTLTLEWGNPFPEECPVTFNVTWERNVLWDADLFEINSTTTGATSYKLEKVIPGAEYTFFLTVQFQGNESGATDSITCNTLAEASSPPVLTVADAGTSFLYLIWEAPTSANGVIQNYDLRWTDEAGTTHNETIDVVNDYNLTENVLACSVYQVALAAVNAAGIGEWDTKPAETLQEDIGDIACEVANDSSVVVSWTVAPANCDRNGTILSWHGESQWDQYDVENYTLLEGEVSSITLTDLYPYTLYDICVTLKEDWAHQTCCQATTRQGVPAAPELIETSSTKSSVSLSWSEPQRWNGIPSNYLLTCPSAHISEEVDVNTTAVIITELAEGTEYTVTVQACNEEKCSDAMQAMVKTDGETADSNTGLIVGLTLGSVVVVAAIAAVVVRARRKKPIEEEATVISGSVSSLSSM